MAHNIRTRAAFFTVYGVITLILIVLVTTIIMMAIRPAHAADAGSFTLTSSDIASGQLSDNQVFNSFGCTGKNISPGLSWSGAPQGTKSYAVTVYDPDAPTGSGWWHWVVYDIPGVSDGLPTGMGSGAMEIPKYVIQAKNDYGNANFGGACPPKGDTPHHYIFTVYAMPDEHLDVPAGASAALIGFQLKAKKLAEASFTATYGR